MPSRCRHEGAVFLMRQGQLGFFDSALAIWHSLWCVNCRREAKRLSATAGSLRTTAGLTRAFTPAVLVAKVAWGVAVASVAFGMYSLGKGAVSAAMATRDRPQVKQATFSEDARTYHPKRPSQ